MIIAQNAPTINPTIFGTVKDPLGWDSLTADPLVGVGQIIGLGLRVFFIAAGITLLVMMLWGALDWVTSGGEKEKLMHAQQKIIHGLIGFIVMVAAFAIFQLITVDLLGIIRGGPGGWQIHVPTLNTGPTPTP